MISRLSLCVSGSAVGPSTVNSSPTWRNIAQSRGFASKTLTHIRTSVAPCEPPHTHTSLHKRSQEFHHTSLVSLSETLIWTSLAQMYDDGNFFHALTVFVSEHFLFVISPCFFKDYFICMAFF